MFFRSFCLSKYSVMPFSQIRQKFMPKFWIFLYASNAYCGHTLELPCKGNSNVCSQNVFLPETNEINHQSIIFCGILDLMLCMELLISEELLLSLHYGHFMFRFSEWQTKQLPHYNQEAYCFFGFRCTFDLYSCSDSVYLIGVKCVPNL